MFSADGYPKIFGEALGAEEEVGEPVGCSVGLTVYGQRASMSVHAEAKKIDNDQPIDILTCRWRNSWHWSHSWRHGRGVGINALISYYCQYFFQCVNRIYANIAPMFASLHNAVYSGKHVMKSTISNI